MSSSSSECSDDESNHSDYSSKRILSVPWANKESTNKPSVSLVNSFKNDGSFLEMFKKMQEQNNASNASEKSQSADKPTSKSLSATNTETPVSTADETPPSSSDSINKSVNRFVGKRRPTRVLPTGLVKKQRKDGSHHSTKEAGPEPKNDPWSKYMDEVRKYKQQSCSEEESTRRPLVK